MTRLEVEGMNFSSTVLMEGRHLFVITIVNKYMSLHVYTSRIFLKSDALKNKDGSVLFLGKLEQGACS